MCTKTRRWGGGVEIAFHFLKFTVITFFMACVGKSVKIRSSSSDIQIFVDDAIRTLPDQLVFFRPVLHFVLSLCLCALVIWPSRLSSHCEAEEQKDGSNSLCAMPQAKATPPSSTPLPITFRLDSASQRDASPFQSGPDPPYSKGG